MDLMGKGYAVVLGFKGLAAEERVAELPLLFDQK
jgi:hypothetical protein